MRRVWFWWMAVACLSGSFAQAAEPMPVDWTQRRIDPALREGWAYRPLQTVAIPAVDSAGVVNPVDRFLAAAQSRAGVTPNPTVDRRALLRRLSFTLTGLPPAAEEVAAFVADDAPDAVDRCVDRLLASPHYGIRWARHWLDIARFAESHGYEHDYDRPTAHHYRDFVVQAWNADQPFDEFVRWQIAGDQMSPQDRLAWMATGFLAAGPHSTQITKREVERQRYDELDDMVMTISTALLGLNVSCARCHDHPYDPIPQADFYRLAAFFTRTVRSDVEVDFDPAGFRTAQAEFVRKHAAFEDAVARYEATELRTAYQQWRRTALPERLRSTWLLPSTMAVSSKENLVWTEQADGSWSATGPTPKHDEYRLRMQTSARRVTAIRLEALTDPSMTHGGPGRDADGNFALSHVEAFARVKGDHTPSAIPLARAVATFEQFEGSIAGVLDKRDETAWGVDPQLGRPHAAAFYFDKPVDLMPDDELEIRLAFRTRPAASIGRLRVSFSTMLNPAIEEATTPIPERVISALQQNPFALTENEWPAVTRWFAPQDAEWQRLDDLRRDHAATVPRPQMKTVFVATEGRPAIRLHTQAAEEYLPETCFLVRGDPANPLRVANPGVLQILDRGESAAVLNDRAALAKWLTDHEHGAGALLARVIVNRLWQHHFGTGLVATPDDFGTRGSLPSHPALLEWLAGELIRHHWQIKPIQRLLVTSTAFQRSSWLTTNSAANDPENQLFARWTSRRLEAEAIRDAMLVFADALDDRLDGPSEREPEHRRRSLYRFIKRSASDPWFASFDAPDGCRVQGRRPQTTSPAQMLALMNGEQTHALARIMAERRTTNADDPIRHFVQRVLQRDPSPIERESMVRLLDKSPTVEQWTDLCHVLLSLDEFVYLD